MKNSTDQTARRLYVPAIGDRLELVEPWTFKLHNERRNTTLFAALGLKYTDSYDWIGHGRYGDKPVDVTLPAGAVLRVDRIYIRQGLDEFSSLSFFVEGTSATVKKLWTDDNSGKHKRAVRFWAKLDDCNRIVFRSATTPPPKAGRAALLMGSAT